MSHVIQSLQRRIEGDVMIILIQRLLLICASSLGVPRVSDAWPAVCGVCPAVLPAFPPAFPSNSEGGAYEAKDRCGGVSNLSTFFPASGLLGYFSGCLRGEMRCLVLLHFLGISTACG
jgi:hypothetical protein